MPGHKICLGEPGDEDFLEFPTKAKAIEFFRAMMNRYHAGTLIPEPDSAYLLNLLERHPRAQQKFGDGVSHFFKKKTDQGTFCFWLRRNDGSETDFSFYDCVSGKSKSPLQEFAEACRTAVEPELALHKARHFEEHGDAENKVACEITKERIAIYESHLDHKKPLTFQVIVLTFLTANAIDLAQVRLRRPGDGEHKITFEDEALAERFRIYHRGLAQLRIVKPRENLRLGGSERVIPPKRPVRLD